MHYVENMASAEIGACLGLTERDVDRLDGVAVGLLKTLLAAQLGQP